MAHAPVTLPYDPLRELPAVADERSRTDALAGAPCYRSEAFAEDLFGTDAVPEAPAHRARGWLSAAPLGVALAGALVAAFGGRG